MALLLVMKALTSLNAGSRNEFLPPCEPQKNATVDTALAADSHRRMPALLLLLVSFAVAVAAPVPLRVGMELSYPPFETIGPDGKPAGISVELAQGLADGLGRPLVIENISFPGLIPSLKSGKIDVIISSMTATPERAKAVAFSDPYLTAGLAALVPAASTAQGPLNHGWEQLFRLAGACGNAFLPSYAPIVEKRSGLPYGERERQFQLYRRGRYVEFNLVFDRGTIFGLQTNGRTESILMSLPPLVRWEYGYVPEPGSREALLTELFTRPQEWLSDPSLVERCRPQQAVD